MTCILYPILHYPPVIGGLEQWSQNIAERQPGDIEIFIVTGKVLGEPNFEKKGNVTIVRTSFFALSDLSHSSIIYIATAVPFIFLRSLLLSQNARAFHCHGFVSAIMGYFLSALTGKPFICTEQSIKLRNPVLRHVAGVAYGKAAVCIGSSGAVEEEFKKMGIRKITAIPNGVDLEKFTNVRGRTSRIDSPFVILSVGRLEKVKGHKYLVEAFADIKKEIPNARLILVGDGSERDNLEKQADELGIGGAIEFAGEILHDELPRWYHGADVFVMPSLSEGFGITAIEAMASVLAVVATRVGSLPEIVRDGETGILVERGNAEQIYSAVLRIYRDETLRLTLEENGKREVQKFDWRNSATEVYKIYLSLV
jgi:glycosyltransferase involved in cell wall biosynthesis